MSNVNELSEKDLIIKNLRSKQTDNKDLKKSINDKLKALEDNKTIEK
jgi:hypothetical protein